MKKYNTGTIVFTAIALFFLALLVWLALFSPSSQQSNWQPDLKIKGKNPFDVSAFYAIAKKTFKVEISQERVQVGFPKDSMADGKLYMYVGVEPHYTEAEAEHLLKFVERGGTAFIAAQHLPDSLMQFLLFANDCGFQTEDNMARMRWRKHADSIRCNFTHPKFAAANDYKFVLPGVDRWYDYSWAMLPENQICAYSTYPIAALGYFDLYPKDKELDSDVDNIDGINVGNLPSRYINFFRMRVGEGHFYFHTCPIMFSNYFLRMEETLEYTNKILSQLKPTKVYWDDVSNVPAKPQKQQDTRARIERNPMEYIFAQTPLRNAWYMLLGGTILFALFRAKRRQRIVPITEANHNTSLEFVETISQLYFQQQNHKVIYQKLMQHFLTHLRQRYQLVTRERDEKLIQKICVRADMPRELVAPIFDTYNNMQRVLAGAAFTISSEQLNDFYFLIERFHRYEAENVFNKNE